MRVFGFSVLVLGVLFLSVTFSSAAELQTQNSGPQSRGFARDLDGGLFVPSERPEILLMRATSTASGLIDIQDPSVSTPVVPEAGSQFQLASVGRHKSLSDVVIRSTFGVYAYAGSMPEPVLLLILGGALLSIAGVVHKNRIQKRNLFTRRTAR